MKQTNEISEIEQEILKKLGGDVVRDRKGKSLIKMALLSEGCY